MNQNKPSEYPLGMISQLIFQENLFQYLPKVDAMVEALPAKELIDCPNTKLHDYMLVISELIDNPKSFKEDFLDRLVKLRLLLSPK